MDDTKRFYFQASVDKVFKTDTGRMCITAVSADTLVDKQGDEITLECLEDMAHQAVEKRAPLLETHWSTFALGWCIEAKVVPDPSTNSFQFIQTFELNDRHPLAHLLFEEHLAGKNDRRLSVGCSVRGADSSNVLFTSRGGKVLRSVKRVHYDHTCTARDLLVVNDRTSFLQAVLKTISEFGTVSDETPALSVYSGPGDPKLPENVKKKGKKDRERWVSVWNNTYNRCESMRSKHKGEWKDPQGHMRKSPKDCEAMAFAVANGVMMKASAEPEFAKFFDVGESLLVADTDLGMERRTEAAHEWMESPLRGTVSFDRSVGRLSAVWTAKYVNDLPDTAFALILEGGEKDEEGRTKPRSLRKLPHHSKNVKSPTENTSVDLPHLRNALARAPQMTGVSDAQRSRAIGHLRRHASELLKTDDSGLDAILKSWQDEDEKADPNHWGDEERSERLSAFYWDMGRIALGAIDPEEVDMAEPVSIPGTGAGQTGSNESHENALRSVFARVLQDLGWAPPKPDSGEKNEASAAEAGVTVAASAPATTTVSAATNVAATVDLSAAGTDAKKSPEPVTAAAVSSGLSGASADVLASMVLDSVIRALTDEKVKKTLSPEGQTSVDLFLRTVVGHAQAAVLASEAVKQAVEKAESLLKTVAEVEKRLVRVERLSGTSAALDEVEPVESEGNGLNAFHGVLGNGGIPGFTPKIGGRA